MSLVDGMVFNALIAWNVRNSGSKPSSHADVKTYDLVLAAQGISHIETYRALALYQWL